MAPGKHTHSLRVRQHRQFWQEPEGMVDTDFHGAKAQPFATLKEESE
ncbi:hypothetical protein ACLF3G_03185 [Falsiroseomonas sp. HC035]